MSVQSNFFQKIFHSSPCYIYCFDISYVNGKKLKLVTGARDLFIKGDCYKASSCLEIQNIILNDFGGDEVKIAGIFNQNGISKNLEILDAAINISVCTREEKKATLSPFLGLKCTEITESGDDFVITLRSYAANYEKSILDFFSKTCRADFLDNKCKLREKDIEIKLDHYEIIDLKKIKTKLQNNFIEYARSGRVIFILNDTEYSILIENILQTEGLIQLELKKEINFELNAITCIKILPSCDKRFLTCCKKFNNAVNFRGEPFLPEHSFINN